MPDKVNLVTNRGSIWLYHWIVYMLGGFRHCKTASDGKIYIIFEKPHENLPFHTEALTLLRDTYRVLDTVPANAEVNVSYGEPLLGPTIFDDVHHDTYPFLRKLFLERVVDIPKQIRNSKGFYYITRRNANACPGNYGKRIRDVLNEEEFLPALESKGFVRIQFEELSFVEKIQLFETACIIISPGSACLSFSCCASMKTHIVEILPQDIQHHDHYKNMCKALSIPYHRFTSVHTVGESPGLGRVWNMFVHVEPLLHKVDELLHSV